MKIKYLLLWFLVLTSTSVAITDPAWLTVSTVDSTVTYIDKAHIKLSERIATVWVKTQYGKPRYENFAIRSTVILGAESDGINTTAKASTASRLDGDNNSYTYDNVLQIHVYDCQAQEYRVTYEQRYLKHEAVRAFNYREAWSIIIPGTTGAAIYNSVCGYGN